MKNAQPIVCFLYKQVPIYFLIFIIVLLGHGLLMKIPIETFKYIRHSVISMLCIICFFGAFMIMTQKKPDRADRLFIFLLIMIGLTNLVAIVNGLTLGYAGVVKYEFMSPAMLIYGIIFAFIFLLYPLEALRPGWLTFKRAFLLFSPTLAYILAYFIEIKILHNSFAKFENLTIFLAESNWYTIFTRFLLLLYPVGAVVVMLIYRSGYVKWCENNFASMKNIDIKWLDDYIFVYLMIEVSSMIVVLSNNIRSVLMHNIIFLVFFLYGFYRVLFWKSPYPEGFFKESMSELKARQREDKKILEESVYLSKKEISIPIKDTVIPEKESQISEQDTIINKSFTEKLPQYKEKLEEWMETEKPYLSRDFKLIDAMDILPLNRSYLSQLFNEGYGETFYQFVMRYRLEESKRLLLSRPDLTITNIAELSGFSSPSVFGRAFTQHMNCSPIQWRERNLGNKGN